VLDPSVAWEMEVSPFAIENH